MGACGASTLGLARVPHHALAWALEAWCRFVVGDDGPAPPRLLVLEVGDVGDEGSRWGSQFFLF